MNLRFHTFNPSGEPTYHDYGKIYFREPSGDSERLVIATSKEQVSLLEDLTGTFPSEEVYVLYVLLVSRLGHASGRYQSPLVNTHEELRQFLHRFQTYFESDGRHHLWIVNPDGACMLVYDQHNVIFAYGDLDAIESRLIDRGYAAQEFWFPCPHGHSYCPENDRYEDEIVVYFDWRVNGLQEGDEWA